jgi:hypothetical protein
MKRMFLEFFALALLFSIASIPLAQAQTPEVATRTSRPLSYNVAQEVTLNGTVSSVLRKPTPGMIMGSHLLLATSSGPVDVSLGRFGLLGNDAFPIAAGQQIEVTGVMKLMKDKQVFLVRTVKADGRVYAVRNEHGIPVSPQARERASRKMAGEEL